MRSEHRVLTSIVIACAVVLRSAHSEQLPLDWKMEKLLEQADSAYRKGNYEAASQDFQTVLSTTNRFGDARFAALQIFRIWKKGSDASTTSTAAVNDGTLERCIDSLRRFDQNKERCGTTVYTEGEESRRWRAYLLAQYYEQRRMPQRVVDQKREAKLVHERLLAARERQTERKARLEIYSDYVTSSLELAEAYLANSNRDNCKAELENLKRFYEEMIGRDIKISDYDNPRAALFVAAEVPSRAAKCYGQLGMEKEQSDFAARAANGLKALREAHPSLPAKEEEKAKEIEKALHE